MPSTAPNSPFASELTQLHALADPMPTELRPISMQFSTTHGRAEYKGLYVAYKEAWQRFSSNVSYWQSLESAAPEDGVAVELARDAMRQAEASYRESRNLRAEYMLARSSSAKELVNC